MPGLGETQERFAAMLPGLINKAIELGYKIRLGDLYRDPRVHGEMGVKQGYGHRNSCHKLRLAIDINLVKDGKLLGPEAHAPLHDYWDSVGGAERIPNDMNHYSLGWNGVR